MDVRRHERAGRKSGVPGKRILAELLGDVGLTEDIPNNAVDAGIGLRDACGERLHYARTPLAGLSPSFGSSVPIPKFASHRGTL